MRPAAAVVPLGHWGSLVYRNGIGVLAFMQEDSREPEITMYADANDRRPWTEQDLQDLRACIDSGLSVSQTAAALSREGTIEEILRVAHQHGWKFHTMNGEELDRNL